MIKINKILHITPHLGGGVGSTILGYISKNKSFEHEIVAFGYTIDSVSEKIKSLKIPYTDNATYVTVLQKIPHYDIVLIHQWNHPLLMDFLVRCELPQCRLVMLGHNSGSNAPNIYTKKILEYPDIFVFTTPLSYEVDDVAILENKDRLYSVWSTDGVDEYKDIEGKKHKGFIIGYIGTVDYAKLHPDFLEMCKGIDFIPNLKFVVVGGNHQKEIEAQANEMGIGDMFEFAGYVPKATLKDYLESFDIFGYPLAPYHYGTCDLVLQIAMGSGVVPVVFDNPMEKLFVMNNKTGLIVKDKKGYIQAIKDLYNNINWRKELGRNAKEDAIKRFTLEKLDNEWEKVFKKVLEYPKISRKWDINKKEITHADVFLESLGRYGKDFRSYYNAKNFATIVFVGDRIKELGKIPSWQTETKGSVHNYHAYFPDDKWLKNWSEIMKEEL